MSASPCPHALNAEDNVAAGPLSRYPPPRGLSWAIWTGGEPIDRNQPHERLAK
jgi:hypothetical protein